ncbi:MAG: reductive dehalogenase domain-containing protein, partial [Dehalogenimonas sp.]
MPVFHSTVSRREFMKNLGLAGAGLGAAALVAPQFHDLDEMMSAEKAVQKRPWFVKERDFYDPSVEHDWDVINRYDRRWQSQTTRIKSYFTETWNRRQAASDKGAAISDARTFQTPGYTLPSRALHAARAENLSWSKSWTGPTGISESKTPEEFGTTKWSGTPEENSRLMNAAMRYYGSIITGFAEFDDVWKNKMMVSYTTRGATKDWSTNNGALPSEDESLRYVFEDVDKGYDTPSKKVFPGRKQLYIITTASPVASQFLKA